MYRILFIPAIFFLVSCKPTSYFIIRHAEKASETMASDVPLSDAGKRRAEALRELLKNEKISQIYSTNYLRTKGTVQPLSDATGTGITVYDSRDTAFVGRLKKEGKGAVVIVGHSNTVDDMVNNFMSQDLLTDLADNRYGDLFIIRKKGKKFSFEQKRFGQ
jgi:broad specificity phosphatase PhoE